MVKSFSSFENHQNVKVRRITTNTTRHFQGLPDSVLSPRLLSMSLGLILRCFQFSVSPYLSTSPYLVLVLSRSRNTTLSEHDYVSFVSRFYSSSFCFLSKCEIPRREGLAW
jgi:hypothetical protein